ASTDTGILAGHGGATNRSSSPTLDRTGISRVADRAGTRAERRQRKWTRQRAGLPFSGEHHRRFAAIGASRDAIAGRGSTADPSRSARGRRASSGSRAADQRGSMGPASGASARATITGTVKRAEEGRGRGGRTDARGTRSGRNAAAGGIAEKAGTAA